MKVHARINMLAGIACTRYFKTLWALQQSGAETTAYCQQVTDAAFCYEVGPISFWATGHPKLALQIRADNGPRIWHVHAEPCGLAASLRKIDPLAPIVLDIHDARWGMGERPTPAEVADLWAADSVVVPSRAYAARLPSTVDALGRSPMGCVVVHSGCMGAPAWDDTRYRIGVAYEGGVDVGGWRDYRDLVRSLVASGSSVSIYSHAGAEADVAASYRDAGASIRHLQYPEMLRAMAGHCWSLVGPPADGCAAYRSSSPNKYFESIQAGTPVITWGIDEVAELVARDGTGVVVKSIADVARVVTTHQPRIEGLRMVPDARWSDCREACKTAYPRHLQTTCLPALEEAYCWAQDAARRREATRLSDGQSSR